MVVIYVNLYIYDNIIVDDKGHCCLADFGASSIVATHLPPTATCRTAQCGGCVTNYRCTIRRHMFRMIYLAEIFMHLDAQSSRYVGFVRRNIRWFTRRPHIYTLEGFPTITLGVFTRIWKKKEGEKKNPEGSRPFVSMLKLLLFCTCNRSMSFFRSARTWHCINFSWS